MATHRTPEKRVLANRNARYDRWMWGWVKRHKAATIGGVSTGILPVWKFLSFVVGRGGDVDFVVSRAEDPGWVGDMLEFMLSPPAWIWEWAWMPFTAAGLGLIWWDSRRNRAKSLPAVADGIVIEHDPSPPLAARSFASSPHGTNIAVNQWISVQDAISEFLPADMKKEIKTAIRKLEINREIHASTLRNHDALLTQGHFGTSSISAPPSAAEQDALKNLLKMAEKITLAEKRVEAAQDANKAKLMSMLATGDLLAKGIPFSSPQGTGDTNIPPAEWRIMDIYPDDSMALVRSSNAGYTGIVIGKPVASLESSVTEPLSLPNTGQEKQP